MKEYINTKLLDMDVLSKIVKISTMSATCKLGSNINLDYMYKYLKLETGHIVTIKHKDNERTVEEQKKKKKKKKSFHNQISVKIRPDAKKFPEDKINVKIFKNGSLQMSGIRSLDACNCALNKLINALVKDYAVLKNNGEMEEIHFVEKKEDVKVTNFKINMINSGFNIGFEVNRDELHSVLLKQKIQCKYEPCIHACVNIKFHPDSADKKISIFVFESGNIIITGAKQTQPIVESYNYIKKLLNKYKNDIQKTQISKMVLNVQESKEVDDLLDVDDDKLLNSLQNMSI